MRLIDGDKMIEHLDLCLAESDSSTPIVAATLTAIKCYVENAPTVDAVEVVRCKDCRYFICNLIPDGYLPEGVGETECTLFHFGADYTDFCSRGERKTEKISGRRKRNDS